ncbi:hypothetical protein [Paenibacillus planticolens]|uniref:hypothetical protein n=1 Tax=Paenibacillus planticolens TaxID=2654976 RepID=UPI001C0FA445|nr:hypothetical protein [Paenibacillus planticolens]
MTNEIPKNVKVSTLNDIAVSEEKNVLSPAAAYTERLDHAISLWRDGADGSVTAVQEANRMLEQLRLDYPGNPLADAYHGSTMILTARDLTKPLEKLRWSKNGLKLLDKAVAAAPQDGMIRMLRGKAAYMLPEKHFQRTQTAIEDYVFIINQELHQEGFLETEEYSKLIYELGDAYYRIGRNQEAAVYWRRLEQQTQDPKYRDLLKQKLQSLEGKPAIEFIQENVSPTSILVGNLAQAAGTALQRWARNESEKARKEREKKEREKREKEKKERAKKEREKKKKDEARRRRNKK